MATEGGVGGGWCVVRGGRWAVVVGGGVVVWCVSCCVVCELLCGVGVDGLSGEGQPNAAEVDGAVQSQARLDKEQKHLELLKSGRCRLVIVACDTGGKWNDEAPPKNHRSCATMTLWRGREGGREC